MASLSLSSSALGTFSLYNNSTKSSLFAGAPRHQPLLLFHVAQRSNPLRFCVDRKGLVTTKEKKSRGFGAVCYASPITARNLQWIATVSSAVLMLAKGTAAQKSFLVPLFALQAPASVISFIKGEYGAWTAFLALLVRLFFFIPGELELPFVALLLVLVAPHQVMNLRGTQAGAIVSLLIAGYLAFQHFSRTGSLQKAFDQGSIVATLAIILITAASGLLLI
ncbi:cold-regulated 413 inner membrane protein 1, chloroplastic-like [Alnus glutinosa]|uniref:cold-regulated 413 inner membrane protein 1, chloroplastic-like n=1 Tax=Alnus glutinosa TaxID=3517 RepID=UPI002D793C85|nr:cold-regulated 413 inner membrane protein 1, chloroplastic-like [Alnus glutinosa]